MTKSTPTIITKHPLFGGKPGLGIGEIDAKSVIPEDSVLKLENLYRKRSKLNIKKQITTLRPETTTSFKDALDNVSLDEE